MLTTNSDTQYTGTRLMTLPTTSTLFPGRPSSAKVLSVMSCCAVLTNQALCPANASCVGNIACASAVFLCSGLPYRQNQSQHLQSSARSWLPAYKKTHAFATTENLLAVCAKTSLSTVL